MGKREPTADEMPMAPPLAEGMMTDFITGQPVKETEKERVRQEVARQLIFEYQIATENMEADFPVKIEGKRKRMDIAVFEAGKEHGPETLSRAVICRPFPNVGKRSVVKIRDFVQAEKAGVDRHGNALHKRNPDGTKKLVTRIYEEKVKTNGNYETRQRKIIEPEIDDDFPAIGDAYEAFRKKNPEPGA